MNIKFIKQRDKDFRQSIGIFRNNLPKIQTFPYLVMRILLLNPNSHLLGLYENGKLIGAAFFSENSKMIYLMYSYLLEEYRRRHYGSELYAWVKEYAKERAVVCNVEKNNQNTSYIKSVFSTDTGYVRTILGHDYDVLCYNEFDLTEYKKLAKSIYYGFNIVTLEKKN